MNDVPYVDPAKFTKGMIKLVWGKRVVDKCIDKKRAQNVVQGHGARTILTPENLKKVRSKILLFICVNILFL